MVAFHIEWTEEKVARIRHLAVVDGLSAGEIAKQYGCSRNSIIGVVNRRGITLRGSPRARTEHPKHPKKPSARQLEQAILRRANNTRLNKFVLARARAAGDLPALEEVSLPDESPDRPRVKLMHLRNGQCRWPIGDSAVNDPDFGFCGDPVIEGKSYCGRHYRVAYRPTVPRWLAPSYRPSR